MASKKKSAVAPTLITIPKSTKGVFNHPDLGMQLDFEIHPEQPANWPYETWADEEQQQLWMRQDSHKPWARFDIKDMNIGYSHIQLWVVRAKKK